MLSGSKQIWFTKADHLVIVTILDKNLYYYEYFKDHFLMFEKSPKEFGMEFIGDL